MVFFVVLSLLLSEPSQRLVWKNAFARITWNLNWLQVDSITVKGGSRVQGLTAQTATAIQRVGNLWYVNNNFLSSSYNLRKKHLGLPWKVSESLDFGNSWTRRGNHLHGCQACDESVPDRLRACGKLKENNYIVLLILQLHSMFTAMHEIKAG